MPAYKDKDGRWRYRFAYAGTRHSGSTPKGSNTRKVAEFLERRDIDNLIARRYTGKMPTVREFADKFLEHQAARTKPLTQAQQRATVNSHLVPGLGSLRLDQVEQAHIDRLVTKWRGAGNKPKTVNTRLGTIRRLFSLAVEWRILAEVPHVEFLPEDKETPRFLSDGEMQSLVDAALPQWRSMILVALRTGLRIGELRGLQWGDIDLARRIIQVRRTDPGRRTMDATSPKGKRERTVPLTNDAARVIEDLRKPDMRPSQFVWPALLKRTKETRARCRSEKGCHHGVVLAAQAAKLGAGIGWHTLRHTYASHLVMRGVPLRTVQGWLGHASITMTEKYSHLSPDYGHAAANLLDLPLALPRLAKLQPRWLRCRVET